MFFHRQVLTKSNILVRQYASNPRQSIGFAALPDTFVKILKITGFGLSTLLVVKMYVNKGKNEKHQPDHVESQNREQDTSKIRPGFPESIGSVQRKSEYEGGGSSYMTRKSGDKFT